VSRYVVDGLTRREGKGLFLRSQYRKLYESNVHRSARFADYPVYRFANSRAKGRAGERDDERVRECRPTWKRGWGRAWSADVHGVFWKLRIFPPTL